MSIPLSGRRIWLTGASTGIGRACALEFARRGARLALSARNAQALDALVAEIGPDRALAVPLDVTDRAANHAAVARIAETFGGLDTVVFNAGTCEYVEETSFDADLFDRVLATNLHASIYGMEAALPILSRGVSPHLVAVSSSTAWLPLPRAEAYGASKAAQKYLLDSFRLRSEKRGLWVTGVYPGFVKTPLTDRNDFPMPFLVTAEDAARRIADGIEARRREIHFPLALTWPMKVLGILPTWIYQPLVSRLVEAP